MFSVFKTEQSNSSSAVNNVFAPRTVSKFNWAKIYNREGTSGQNTDHIAPIATVNMQSARSTGNLDQLGRGIEDMDLNARTATSTPNMPAEFADPGVPPRTADVQHDAFEDAVVPETQQQIQNEPEVADALPIIPPIAADIMPDTEPTPRADRLIGPVTPQNAQGRYKPNSLLFVANLSAGRSDEELAAIVHEAFTRFGFNVVNVRRDKHQNPFALVQFDNIENAQQALAGSRNMVVGGRKIRVEEAEARRSVIFYKSDGTFPSNQEVFHVLRSYGHIEDVKPTTHADAAHFGLPVGCWVKFSFYLDCKDLVNQFNNYNGEYLIMEAPKLDAQQRGPVIGATGRGFHGPNAPLSLADTRSIFIGSLPYNVTESELGSLFGRFGDVRLVNIIRKSVAGQGFNTFAFVEFSNVHEAQAATQTEVDLRGKRIRVEPKQYSTRRFFRAYGQLPPPQEYRPIPWGPPAQSPQQQIPYGFQPIMGNQRDGPIVPYSSGTPWNTQPPGGYGRLPPRDPFFDGPPHTPGHTFIPYGPHGTYDPQAYNNPPTYNGPQAYGSSQAYGGGPAQVGPPPIPQGPRTQMRQVAHMGSRAPHRGVETMGNDFDPPRHQQR